MDQIQDIMLNCKYSKEKLLEDEVWQGETERLSVLLIHRCEEIANKFRSRTNRAI
jgi:hypothetical protein